jgi:hypothetical protein
MGYIDPWQIPTPIRVPKPKKDDEDCGGTPASEKLLNPNRGVVDPDGAALRSDNAGRTYGSGGRSVVWPSTIFQAPFCR